MSTSRTAAPTASSRAARRSAAHASRRPRTQQPRRRRISRLLAWLLAAWLGSAGWAMAQVAPNALPSGAQLKVGSAQLVQSGSLLTIQQNSAKLGLDWQSFNIGSGATVEFRQPDAGSIALNRVVGNSGSEIYGRLKANGQVFLTNPNGVLFAPGARVDVGGLVASTLDLSQQDFADGKLSFTATGATGSVVNQGTLRAGAGGYLALFGQQVRNEGEIAVDAGAVMLASGRAATVSISGSGLLSAVVTPGAVPGRVDNAGRIVADGGTVTLSAKSAQDIAASLVNNSGIVRANTLVERAGEVWLTGDTVATSGTLSAASEGAGAAGRINVVADLQRGTAQVAGRLDASAARGDGGFIETSGARVRVDPAAAITTLSTHGRTGTWLVDPTDLNIGGPNADISAATVADRLVANNVALQSSEGAGGTNGDVNVLDPISWTSGFTLTLSAARHVNINADISASGGNAGLVLNPGAAGQVILGATGRVTLSGTGAVYRVGNDNYTLIHDLTELQAVRNATPTTTARWALAVDIDAGASAALNNGLGFNPIGANTNYGANNSFRGRFDGLGHSITGLTINRPTQDYVGLFGVTHDATIANVRLVGGSITGRNYVGPLVGYALTNSTGTTIVNAHSSAAVALPAQSSFTVYGGGLVGRFDSASGSISRSSASGDIANDGYYASLGGLVGTIDRGTIDSSSASGDILGTTGAVSQRLVGGLVGEMNGATSITGTSSASGDIVRAQQGGGLVGQFASTGSITGATASGNVSAELYAGGLAGYASGTISNSHATGTVAGANTPSNNQTVYVGGLVGYYEGSSRSITGSDAGGNVSSAAPYGYVGGLVGFVSSGSIGGSTAAGSVSASNPIDSRQVGGLVGGFGGSGTLMNSRSTGTSVSGGYYAGGLVGQYYSSGKMEGVESTAAVSGTQYAGGLVGMMSDGSIASGIARGDVSSGNMGGGLVGYLTGTTGVADSQAFGDVNAVNYAGGLVGYAGSAGTIDNGRASGKVFSTNMAGGLVGYLYYSNVTRSKASGSVTVVSDNTVYAGGLVGRMYNYNSDANLTGADATGDVFTDARESYVGGLAGSIEGSTLVLDHGTATGNVVSRDINNTGYTRFTGGLVGQFRGLRAIDSSASGNVIGGDYVGGLFGQFSSAQASQSDNLRARGNVSGTSYVGGLAGYWTTGSLSNSSATGSVTASGSAYAGGLIGQASGSGTGVALDRVTATGEVNGGVYTGGLVGYFSNGAVSSATAGITEASASGRVAASASSFGGAGGLVGYFYSYNSTNGADRGIRGSSATGDVSGPFQVGGLVGYYEGAGGIQDSGASGRVSAAGNTSSVYLGGLAGRYLNGNSTAGAGRLERSYGRGAVSLVSTTLTSGVDVYAGGLAGWLGSSTTAQETVLDSYATGSVTISANAGRLRAGGLIGQVNGSLNRVYASGAVSITGGNTRTLGGLVAVRNTGATATSAFWSTDGTGQSASALGTGKTTAELSTAATFAGWDVATTGATTSVWRLYEGLATPLLRAPLKRLSLPLSDITKVYDGSSSLGGVSLGSGVANPERILLGGLAKDAGTYALSAANVYSTQDGYDLSITGSGNLTITQRQLTLAGLVADKVYDRTTTATLRAGAQPGGLVPGEDLVFVPGAGFALNFDDRSAGSNKGVTFGGSFGWTDGTKGRVSNYLLPTGNSSTASITPAPLSAGSITAVSRAYDGSTSVVLNTSAATLQGVFAGDSVTVDLSGVHQGTLADKNVGTAKPVAVQGAVIGGPDAANYRIAGADAVTVDITPRTAALNGITAFDRQYNAGLGVSLNANSVTLAGLVAGDIVEPVTSSLVGRVADKNVGSAKAVTVTGASLRGPDAANYAPQVTAPTVNISPYQITLSLQRTTQTDREYNGSNAATATLSRPFLSGDDISASATSITYADENVAYNGSGQVTSKTITAAGLALAGADKDNYQLLNASATTSGTIRPRPLAVTGVAALNRVYDGTRNVTVDVSAAAVDVSNVVSGDDVQPAIPGQGTVVGQMADKNIGTGKAVTVPGLSLTGADAGNYTLNSSSNGVTVNITAKDLTAVYTGVAKVYDGNPHARVNVSSADIVSGDDVGFFADQSNCYGCGYAYFTDVAGNFNTTNKNVGDNRIISVRSNGMFGNDASNYRLLNSSGTTSANVTPKPVTLVMQGVTKVYDGTTGAQVTLNRGASGLYSGDDLGSTQTAVFTGATAKNVGTGKPVSVSGILLTGNDAFNYAPGNTTTTTTANVTKKPVTVSGIAGVNRAYDGTTTVAVAATGTIGSAGFVSGDDVAVQPPPGGLSSGTITNKNAGTAKPVTVTGLTLSGTDAGNYQIDAAASSITVDITPRLITPAYTGGSKVYDGLFTAPVTASLADIISGDAIGFTQSALFSGDGARDVGTGKPITVSNIALTNNTAGNYALAATTASTTGSITAKPVTAQYSGLARVYSGLLVLDAPVLGDSPQLLLNDDVHFAQTAVFTGDGSAGTNKPVAVTNIRLTGAAAGNYVLQNTSASTTATITPRPLGVTGITAIGRVYDGTTTVSVNASGAQVDTSNVVSGDSLVLNLPPDGISTGTLADRHVGAAKPVSITGLVLGGSSAANYQLVGATGLTAAITPRPLTASYTGIDKTYDGNANAQVSGSSSDLLPVDAALLGIQAVGSFTGGKNAGTGKAIAVSGGFLTGGAREDYALQNPSGSTSADILPREVTTSYSGLSRVYDGSVTANVSGSVNGRIGNDVVSLVQQAVFTGADAKNVGTNKPVDVTGIQLAGADAANYVLRAGSDTANTTATITKKPITVGGLSQVVATDRIYDGTTHVDVTVPSGVTLQPNSADIVAGDVVSVIVPSSGLTSGTMLNKNVGVGKAVNVSGLDLAGTDARNYSINGTAGITVTITPRPLTASYNGISRVYDGTNHATVSGSSADLLAGDSLAINGSGIFVDGKNVGTGKGITVQQASLAGTDRFNYTLQNPTGSASADVTPLQLAPVFSGIDKVYDGTADAQVAVGNVGFIAGDAVSLTQQAVFRAGKNAGTGKIVDVSGVALTGADKDNYRLGTTSATTTASITRKSLRIDGLTGVSAVDRVYDGTLSVNVLVGSSGPLAPSAADLVPGDVVSVQAPPAGTTTGLMADKHAGTNKSVAVQGLTLSGADGGNYTVAAATGVTVNITPKPLTATFTGIDRDYDGTTAAQVRGASADLVSGDAVTITGTGLFTGGKNAGVGKAIAVNSVSLQGADRADYLLQNTTGSATATIAPRNVTASFTGVDKVYDGSDAATVTGRLSFSFAGDDVSLTETAVFAGPGGRNAGDGKAIQVGSISLGGVDAPNYNLLTSTAGATASITKRPLRIDGIFGVTAVDRVYDGTTVVAITVQGTGSLTPNTADLVTGDVVTVSLPSGGLSAGTMADKNVGKDKPVTVAGLVLGGADGGNYRVAATAGVTVDIDPRPLTAAWTAASRVYDGTAVAAVSGSSADIIGGDALTLAATGSFSGGKNVGTGKQVEISGGTLRGADAGNYALQNATGTASANITPKRLTPAYTASSRVYDGSTGAQVSAQTAGIVEGDDLGLAQTAAFADKNAGDNKTISVTGITLTGADRINYELASTSATATASITPKPVNVSGLNNLQAVSRVYDGTTDVQITSTGSTGSAASGDFVTGDDVAVALDAGGLGSGQMADKNAGTGKSVAISGLSLTGADRANYRIAGTLGLTVDITPRPLTASWTVASRVYDGTAAAVVNGSSGDIIAGDALTLGAVATFADGKNAGTGKRVAITAGALAGTDAANYVLRNPTATATADIAQKAVTPQYAGITRVYDGTLAAQVTAGNTGFIAGDDVGLSQTAAFASKDAAEGKAIGISGITLTGADAANYALGSTTAIAAGTITPRPVNVSGLSNLRAVNRVYDGTREVQVITTGATGTAASGDFIAGDDVAVALDSGGLGNGLMVDKNAGRDKPVAISGLSLTGADRANYRITGTAGVTVTIDPRPVSVTGLAAVGRVYDGTGIVALDAQNAALSGALAGDDLRLAAVGGTGTMADAHAGTGKAVTASGVAFAGADAGNYVATGAGALTVDIARRPVSALVVAANRVYDGSTGAAITLTGDGLLGSDGVKLVRDLASFADKNAGTGKTVTVTGIALDGANAGDYLLTSSSTLTSTATILPRPLTVAAATLDKFYGDLLDLAAGTAFTTSGLVDGETIGRVTLASDGLGAKAPVRSGGYALTATDARGGSFDPANYALSYTDGKLTVKPRELTITGVNVARYAGDPNPDYLGVAGSTQGYSVGGSGLVAGEALAGARVDVATPGSKDAPGGSVFRLVTSDARFATGTDASNYTINYVGGLLVVLPKPPLAGEGGGTGGEGLAIVADPAEVDRAIRALDRTQWVVEKRAEPRDLLAAVQRAAEATDAEVAVLLAGESRRISLATLLKLPLISFDPTLRRLTFRAPAGATTP